jgi:hypothetical protein
MKQQNKHSLFWQNNHGQGRAPHSSTVQYGTTRYSTVQYSTVQLLP